jgi:PAS domain S-box-containing protein
VWQNRSVMMVAVRDTAERQRAEDALKQRNREWAVLNRSAQALTSTLNLSEVLELVLDELRRLLDVSASSLWLIDPATHELVCRQSTGPRAETVRGWRISVDQGIVGWTAKTNQSVIIDDAQTDERHFPGVDQSTGMSMRSIVSVPLRVQHQVIGVIQAVDEMPARFDTSALRLIELLANAAAIAVENARLYGEIRRYAVELETRVAERTTELQAERNRLQIIFDSAGEGIQIMDRDFVITYCNPATERITGYSAAEITGLPSRLAQSDQAQSAMPFGGMPPDMRPTLERGEVWRGELVSRRKDGTAFDLTVTLSPLCDSDGQLSGYVAVLRDITRLKELDRLRDQFVSRIGHELRTPLTSLIIYLDLLETGKVEKRAQYLMTLQREADRLRRLVEGFLKIAELDANRVGAELQATDLNLVAGGVIYDHLARAARRQQQLVFEPDTRLPPALIDADLVRDAIRRLLDNALSYTPLNGRIVCSTQLIAESNETWLTVSVKDNGPGLAADDLPRMFERFYRGHASRDYTVPGVGLSLAICRETMAKLGGRITVDSEPALEGRGASFTLWLRPA